MSASTQVQNGSNGAAVDHEEVAAPPSIDLDALLDAVTRQTAELIAKQQAEAAAQQAQFKDALKDEVKRQIDELKKETAEVIAAVAGKTPSAAATDHPKADAKDAEKVVEAIGQGTNSKVHARQKAAARVVADGQEEVVAKIAAVAGTIADMQRRIREAERAQYPWFLRPFI